MEYWQIRKAVKECLMAALITAAIIGCLFCVYMLRAPRAEAAPLSGDTVCSMFWDNATQYNDTHNGEPGYLLLDQDITDTLLAIMAISGGDKEGASSALVDAANGPCEQWRGAIVSYFQRLGKSLFIDNNGNVYYGEAKPATKLS